MPQDRDGFGVVAFWQAWKNKRAVPDKGRWEPGKGEKRRLRYIFVSSLSAIALCEGGSTFQKKRRIL